MPAFDWNNLIENIPDAWRTTEGKGVTIAILDSGATLNAPVFQHLQDRIKTYWVASGNFNALAPPGPGNDPVLDANGHGTECLSVLAGLDTSGFKGIAPQACFVVIKVENPSQVTESAAFVNAVELALKLKVDIITSSVIPRLPQFLPDTRKNAVFSQLAAQKVLMFSTLRNTGLIDEFNKIPFCADREECIATGSMEQALLESLQLSGSSLNAKIDLLLPSLPCICYDGENVSTDATRISCSIATAALAGLAALRLSDWKTQEGANYKPRSKKELLDALRSVTSVFDAANMLATINATVFQTGNGA